MSGDDDMRASGPAGVRLWLYGPFRVAGADGRDLTPVSRKGQAVLALLATAPHHKRTRSWLQDKLWSDHPPAKGATNLRQVLTALRRALGAEAAVLGADRQAVWLDPARCRSDWQDGAARADGGCFLEGLDIGDPEFADWLQVQRSAEPGVGARPGRSPAAPAPARWRPREPRWRVALAGSEPRDPLAAHVEAELLSTLAASLMETGVAEIAADGNDPLDACAIDVGLAITPLGEGHYSLRITVIRPARRRILWSAAEALRVTAPGVGTQPGLMAMIARTQAAVVSEIARGAEGASAADGDAWVLARAAERVFSFDADTLCQTDRALAALEEGPERGVALGLRAQIAVIRDIERLTDTPLATAEEGVAHATHALEAAPFNSQVLAAAANAQVFLRWDIETGADLARLALETNRANPLAWWASANVALYTEAFGRALDHATTATTLARGTPLQFWCQFQLGLAALAAGALEPARRALETSAALAPSFRPPKRYLLALYAHLGHFDRARRMAADLARLEHSFTLDAFARDRDYPISLARNVGLIDPARLIDLGDS